MMDGGKRQFGKGIIANLRGKYDSNYIYAMHATCEMIV
jgi:hypothetical protein